MPENITNFREIKSTQDLIAYLSDSSNRLINTKNKSIQYVYHYTKLSSVVSIIKSKYWRLNSPKNMNDGLEFKNIAEFEQSSAVFFASFMYNSSESIAMWAMYAQPWEDGVFIRIPVAEFKEWIRNTKNIYPVLRPQNQEPTIIPSPIPNSNLSIVRVAYTNADSVHDKSDEILICGKAENNILKNTPHLPDLVGYIKDIAWEYEREVRVFATIDKRTECDGLAIKLSDNLIKSIEIVAGPRFSGELSERIKQEIQYQIATSQSMFSDKLKWIPCDSCIEKSKCDNCSQQRTI